MPVINDQMQEQSSISSGKSDPVLSQQSVPRAVTPSRKGHFTGPTGCVELLVKKKGFFYPFLLLFLEILPPKSLLEGCSVVLGVENFLAGARCLSG